MKKHPKSVKKAIRALFSDKLRANIAEGLAGAVLFLALVGWIAAYGVGVQALLLIAAMTQAIWWLCILGTRLGIKRHIDRSVKELERRGLLELAAGELADKKNYFLDNRESGATGHFIILKNTGDILPYSGISFHEEDIIRSMCLTPEKGGYRVKYYLPVGREYSSDTIDVYLGEDHPEDKAARIISLIEKAADTEPEVEKSDEDIKSAQKNYRRSVLKDARGYGAIALGMFASVEAISVMALRSAAQGMEDMRDAVILSILLQLLWLLPFIAFIHEWRSASRRLSAVKQSSGKTGSGFDGKAQSGMFEDDTGSESSAKNNGTAMHGGRQGHVHDAADFSADTVDGSVLDMGGAEKSHQQVG